MERKNKILTFLVFVCVLVIAISILNFPLSKKTISTRFILSNHMGFDLTPGNLNFGGIVPGYGASRGIVINNSYGNPIRIKIKSYGEISNNLIVSENNFVLNPSESRNVTFSIYTNKSMQLGEYDGKIVIVSKRCIWNIRLCL